MKSQTLASLSNLSCRHALAWGGVITGVLCWSMPNPALSASVAEDLIAQTRPLVIGHRGFPQFAPENTLPSFHLAKIAGADLIELDYHVTRDGAMIVCHDGTVDRTTDATKRWGGSNLRIADKTLAELRELDAGSWFHPPYPNTHLPTLEEALEEIQNGNVTLIERKAGSAAQCLELLRKKKLINAVVIQSFDWDYIADCHRLAPEQVLGVLGPTRLKDWNPTEEEKVLSPRWLDEAKKRGALLAVWNQNVTRTAVAYAHQIGLKVWVYTINDSATADKLLDMGVDGIITNNTSLIWRTMALRTRR
ncbi:MAG TPA: glycerophosphodiester phosphodiesterase family protein [Verrucomicrobiota bacterium]|nr:glycerophosphodiester phosphodiesterase family protein [Verrucomicrobiota bacterium]HNT13891.1 glycerophosphodiester phosphodiesterase family protein [Verrucomicrobiota bacterium]